MVIPVHIPTLVTNHHAGELIYIANARRQPKSEIENIIGKLWFKLYARKNAIETLVENSKAKTEDFLDYRPMLFIGNTTLHTNRPVQNSDFFRLTLISHFFDPSPKWGLGSMLSKIRNR